MRFRRLGLVGLLAVGCLAARAGNFAEIEGPYLGQAPPGLRPKPFAEGLIAPSHSSISISPDGSEIYWAERTQGQHTPRILCTQRTESGWSEPAAPFAEGILGADCPMISPDGLSLYFNAIHPLAPGEEERERLWVSHRTEAGWNSPQPMSETVNAYNLHWQSSVDAAGNLYFGATPPHGRGDDDIYISRSVDGDNQTPERIPLNSDLEETTPFIDPASVYILVSRAGPTGGDIAASFATESGGWTEPVSLALEGAAYPVCPYVSPDGKYLFYLSRGKVYWVDAGVISDARPTGEMVGDV